MGLLGVMGSSVGCSATGERLVSAARDGDLQEAKALLEYNPHLARYSTFGVRNSPLHYSAAHGHHEIVKLLLDSGVDINLRNNRGQTALMLACQLGHWEIVQTFVILGANIHEADNLNGGTALHFAAINGHCRCIRLLLADYVPSVPNIVNIISKRGGQDESIMGFDKEALLHTINKAADGGITAIHMAALNGHVESTLLLLDLGASVYSVTIDDGSIIDLIGAGSTPLHYAACGGNEQCCQLLIARGARLTAKNANGWTPSMVARSWHRNWLDGILSKRQAGLPRFFSSPYLSLPLMSIVKIARECGWRNSASKPACLDTCVVCLERTCSVAAEGILVESMECRLADISVSDPTRYIDTSCRHKFCTLCALYLCSTNIISSVAPSPPGSIACPLCRKGIVSFVKLRGTLPLKELSRTSLSLSVRPTNSRAVSNLILCKLDLDCIVSPLASRSFSSLSCRKFPVLKCQSSLCKEIPRVNSSLIPCRTICQRAGNGSTRCSKATMRMLTKREDHGSH